MITLNSPIQTATGYARAIEVRLVNAPVGQPGAAFCSWGACDAQGFLLVSSIGSTFQLSTADLTALHSGLVNGIKAACEAVLQSGQSQLAGTVNAT